MKKIYSFILVLSLLLSLAITAYSVEFQDVYKNAWYAESVEYVCNKGLMNGVGNGKFEANGTISRAMLVTILYRIEGQPEVNSNASFQDVAENSYYADAVAWAAKHGIVSGYSTISFGPNNPVTREQFAAILYRYSSYKGYDTNAKADLSQFKDSNSISAYAVDAMSWANAIGLLNGKSADCISPASGTVRSEAAAIISRFHSNFVNNSVSSGNDELDTKPNSTAKPGNSTESTPSLPQSVLPVVSADKVTVRAGEKNVAVSVRVEKNPGLLGLMLTVNYDADKLSLVGAENGSAFRGVLDMTKPGRFKSPCNFIWDSVNVRPEQVRDGEILTLYFDVLDNATGSTTVSILCRDAFDNDLHDITINSIDGSITVN